MLKKIIAKLKYPKLLLLMLSFFIGYLIYIDENNFNFHHFIKKLGLLSYFLAGIFFAYGFSAGPAIAMLLLIGKENELLLAGSIASLGNLLGTMVVYQSLRISYTEEIDEFFSHPLFIFLTKKLDEYTPRFIRRYILPAFAGVINATPLPDEFTSALIHASKNISFTTFASVAFIFNAFGIFIILFIGKLL